MQAADKGVSCRVPWSRMRQALREAAVPAAPGNQEITGTHPHDLEAAVAKVRQAPAPDPETPGPAVPPPRTGAQRHDLSTGWKQRAKLP